MTKEDWISELPNYGPWRKYVRNWKNTNGGEEGLNGHIMRIWPEFWRRFYRNRIITRKKSHWNNATIVRKISKA